MAFNNASIYHAKGTRFRIGNEDLRNVESISGLGSGGATEIDITNLTSTAREFATGLPDEGSVTLEGSANMQDPVFGKVNASRAAGSELSFAVIVGAVPSGADGVDGTDGSGFVIASSVGTSAPSLVSQKRTYTTTADAVTFPAISPGDYVKDGANYVKIEKLAQSGTKLVITTSASTTSASTSVDIVQPGVKITFTGRVTTYDRGVSTDEVWRYSITARITGALTTTIGNPDVTI